MIPGKNIKIRYLTTNSTFSAELDILMSEIKLRFPKRFEVHITYNDSQLSEYGVM